MNIIMLGAPGAGKGTQAQIISDRYGIPAISTGSIIRSAIKEETTIGKIAKGYIDRGELVPDDVVIGIVKERLSEDDCKSGFILDGFPRTIPQAEELEKLGVEIDKVLDIEVDDDLIIKRLSGRRECPACGATYHIDNNPSKNGDKCEKCQTQLIKREDDIPETIKSRLDVYHGRTEPLIEYYKKKGNLRSIDGNGSLDDAANEIVRVLEG